MKVVEKIAVGIALIVGVTLVVTIGLDAMVDVASVTPGSIGEKHDAHITTNPDYSRGFSPDTSAAHSES